MKIQYRKYIWLTLLAAFQLAILNANKLVQPTIHSTDHEFEFIAADGTQLSLQFYSDFMIRVRTIRPGEDYFLDDHYEMVASHERTGTFQAIETDSSFQLLTGTPELGLNIEMIKSSLRLKFTSRRTNQVLLQETKGIEWVDSSIKTEFVYNEEEHFCGMGHQSYGLVESLDLAGKEVNSNYGEGQIGDWGYQAVLTVPFYLSSKGYGIFLNSSYQHQFNFGKDKNYGFEIDTKGFEGRMDYFFLYGPSFKDIISRYTKLTGRPRLPQKSIFGLQLSDKGSPKNEGAEWWKEKITKHREAGFPFDHIVNDNRWRAGSGAWSGSWFEWDSTRYPDPVAYNDWCRNHHVSVTLDLNRNITSSCWGWKNEYNVPFAEKYVKEGYSTPDYFNPATRKWVWQLFWKKSFDPALNYPGDALWIDEIDELQNLNDSIICGNGRSWAENENSYPFYVAKAVVGEGWDNNENGDMPGIGESKRPYVWMRGMSAGAQRWATYWTGDLKCDYSWMRKNIRAMQVAGICGFPYFNHDAGGFRAPGPDDPMYIGWAMALGSFTPIWRPHGIGQNKRWPLDRSESCQEAALRYGKMRYELMPYIYSYAHLAQETGLPMARAMVLDYQDYTEAWENDLQYLWGEEMLIAPACTTKDTTLSVWLPPDQRWYDYWSDQRYKGDQTIQYSAKLGFLPIFIKEGAIIPRAHYALSTFDLNPEELILDVYTGKDASFMLYEDDGVTEKFRTKKELRKTQMEYSEKSKTFTIEAAKGKFEGAPMNRNYEIVFHGIGFPEKVTVNKFALKEANTLAPTKQNRPSYYWNSESELLRVFLDDYDVFKSIQVEIE